ncbi:MAG: hypothetical protein ABIQ00_10680 [Chitinophagaceae bacterium]
MKKSPAFNAGVIIKNNTYVDYYGDKIFKDEVLSIGIDNFKNLK